MSGLVAGADGAFTLLTYPAGLDSMRPGDTLAGTSAKYLGSADLRGLSTATAYNFIFRGIASLFGGIGDVQAHVNWVDARLIKN